MARKIGKYELREEIGRGGFGTVYCAFDPTVGRTVAIKLLTGSGDPSVLARFKLEATAAGNLHHKNIITIYDFGQHEDLWYLVMEYLEGEDLQKTMARRKNLSIIDKVQIMSQVAEGLHCAHEHGVIHRDIKPANIMVLPDSTVKLMDFGIARMTDPDASRQTKTGFFVGTLLYISPEQLGGGDATVVADIWAYGVILYELLTGIHPFTAPDMATVMYKIMHVEPASIPSLVPECPEGLGAIVQRALAKDSDSRYQSLEDLKFDLDPVLLELQKSLAEQMLVEVEAACREQRWSEAQTLVRKVLDLDPFNRQGRQLRESLRKKVEVAPRIEALIKSGDGEFEKRNFEGALRSYESALRLDQSDTMIRARISQAQEALEQSKKALNLLKEARAEIQLKNFTAAHRHASEAVEADPSEPQALALLNVIQGEIEKRDRDRVLQEGISRARGLLLLDSYDEAIEELTKLAETAPESKLVAQLLAQARGEKQEREKREQLGRDIDSAKTLVRNGQFSQAVKLLKPLLAQWPNHTELGRLCGYAEEQLALEARKQAVENAHQRAQRLLDAEQFDEAIRLLEQALKAYPGEGLLQQSLESSISRKRARERDEKILQHKTRCEELERQGRISEALQYLERVIREYQGDPVLSNVKTRLQSKWEQQQRAEEIRAVMAKAQAHIADSDWSKATELLDYGCVQYPESQELQAARARSLRLREEHERQRFVAGELERAKQCEQRRDFQSSLSILEGALAKSPNDPALIAALDRVRSAAKIHETNQEIGKERANIEQLLASGQLDAVAAAIAEAKKRFPNAPVFGELNSRLQEALRAQAQKEAVAKRIDEIERIIKSGDLTSALVLIKNAELDFPAEVAFREQKAQVQKQLEDVRSRERKQDIERRVQQINQALLARNYSGGLRLIAAAELAHPSEEVFKKLSAEAKHAEEQSQAEQTRLEIARRKSVIEQAIEDSEFRQALDWITSAQAAYPQETAFQELLEKLNRKQAEVREQEVRRDVARRKTAITEAIGRGALQDAFALIAAALQAHPGESVFSELHREATRAQDATRAEQRRQQVLRATTEIQKALGQSELGRAAELISAARGQFPEQAVFNNLLDDLNARVKRKNIDESVAAIEAALAANEFAKASSLAKRALGLYPQDDRLRVLSENVERAAKYQDCLAKAEKDLKKGRFAAAEESARAALKYAANDSEANDLLRRIGAERFIAEEKEQLRRIQGEIEKLNRSEAFDAAIERAQEGLTRFPNDPVLAEQMKVAQTGSLKLLEARQRERAAAQDDSGDQATQLFEAPGRTVVQPVKVAAAAEQKSGRQPGLLRWFTIAAIAAVVVVGGIYLASGKKPAPGSSEPELSASVEGLTFAYEAGAIPPPQTFSVKSDKPLHLTATSDQKWLAISPAQPVAPTDLEVSIDPSQLTASSHEGKILIAAPEYPNLTRTIPVKVSVTAGTITPPPVGEPPKKTETILLSTQRVQFEYVKDSPNLPAPQHVVIQSGDKRPIPFQVSRSGGNGWLTLSPFHGSTPGKIDLQADARSLAPGDYASTLTISPSGGDSKSKRVESRLLVMLRVAPRPTNPPPAPPPVVTTPPVVTPPAQPSAEDAKRAREQRRREAENRELLGRKIFAGVDEDDFKVRLDETGVFSMKNNQPEHGAIVRGRLLPGFEVDLELVPSTKLLEKPNWENEWKGLKIENRNAPDSIVVIHWKVRKS